MTASEVTREVDYDEANTYTVLNALAKSRVVELFLLKADFTLEAGDHLRAPAPAVQEDLHPEARNRLLSPARPAHNGITFGQWVPEARVASQADGPCKRGQARAAGRSLESKARDDREMV